MEHNIEYKQCVKEQHNIGSTIYHNICNGESYKVNFGGADWIGVGMILCMVVLISVLFYKGIKDNSI